MGFLKFVNLILPAFKEHLQLQFICSSPIIRSFQDLETLRGQLYSAAEYFELSYNNDDQKQILIETLKDYAIKALVNTVDHLGSATYKLNDLVDEKVGEVSDTEFRVSCIEQEYYDEIHPKIRCSLAGFFFDRLVQS